MQALGLRLINFSIDLFVFIKIHRPAAGDGEEELSNKQRKVLWNKRRLAGGGGASSSPRAAPKARPVAVAAEVHAPAEPPGVPAVSAVSAVPAPPPMETAQALATWVFIAWCCFFDLVGFEKSVSSGR
ncbi:unnamed protein product [Symbiodinium sp. CCMP2592]|nr:unnamed protein product [Symbiodinium sp. CCMP2592]